MSKWLLILMMVGFFQYGRSQLSDTLKVVTVYSENDSIIKIASTNASVPYYRITDLVLQSMGVIDIGEALKYIPGANIKDYGGIGGLKTINYRSLGSAHTGIEQDGISIPDQQTGTVNLGNYNVFGIESVEMSSGQIQHKNAFATGYLKANMISVFNTIASSSDERTLIKARSEWLTINALQNSLLAKQRLGDRFTIGLQSNYRFGSGIYNYKLLNGQNSIEAQRAPTNLVQYGINGALRYDHKNLNILVLGQSNQTDQNLPGAVIFYNPANKETLENSNTQGSINIKYALEKHSISGHLFSRRVFTNYFQDFVLNKQGFIENSYWQNHIGGGIVYHYYLGSPTQSIFIGSDMIQSQLNGSQYESSPIRESINSVLGISKWYFNKLKIQGNLTHQQISDQDLEQSKTFSHLSPYLSFAYKPFKKSTFRLRSFYKNTFRMPSFNDLYYRTIGNIDLFPEKANLFNFGLTYQKDIKQLNFEGTIDVYHNIVQNKIIAIPTKNLFNWSMQNIGRTLGQGIDISLLLTKKMTKYTFVISSNQSFNKSIDITDKEGFTYGHQLPYTPKYFATYHLNFQHKYFTTALNMLHSGSRYVLTENIEHNLLNGFVDIGLNIAHSFRLKKQILTVKAQANNILNKNYQVVRSFPMPGRHYQFTLTYQLAK